MADLTWTNETIKRALCTANTYERYGPFVIVYLIPVLIRIILRALNFKRPTLSRSLLSNVYFVAKDPIRVLVHTGLSRSFSGASRSITVVPQILPNTCELATKFFGDSERELWPCTRDQIVRWFYRAIEEKALNVTEFWRIVWLRDYVGLCCFFVIWTVVEPHFVKLVDKWLKPERQSKGVGKSLEKEVCRDLDEKKKL